MSSPSKKTTPIPRSGTLKNGVTFTNTTGQSDAVIMPWKGPLKKPKA